MGWGSGTVIAERMIRITYANVMNKDTRKVLYRELFDCLTDADWDTVDEVLGIDAVFDEVAKEAGWGCED